LGNVLKFGRALNVSVSECDAGNDSREKDEKTATDEAEEPKK
jgi:hypothetical protein